MPVVLLKKQWTPKTLLADQEVGGKPRGITAGSHVYDLAANKKVITLCPNCTHKFNPAKVGFRKEKEFPYCMATCDGCSVKNDPKCSMYIFEELYTEVRSTADERRAWAKRRADAIKRGHY